MFKSIGFIGAGNMATAIIDGMLRNSFLSPDSLYIFEIHIPELFPVLLPFSDR